MTKLDVNCRCPIRFVPHALSWCGPDCRLPERRAWAQGVRDALAGRPPIAGIERESQAIQNKYRAGREAGRWASTDENARS